MVLTKLKRSDIGFVEPGRLGINIELLWIQNKRFFSFAREFSTTLAHEFLHVALAQALGRKLLAVPVVEEEETIRAMLGEEWNEGLEKEYIADDTQ